jgi:hypothetical protein
VRLDFEERYYRESMSVSDYYAEYPGNQVVYFSSYYQDENRAKDFTLEQWSEDHKLRYFIRCRNAVNIP